MFRWPANRPGLYAAGRAGLRVRGRGCTRPIARRLDLLRPPGRFARRRLGPRARLVHPDDAPQPDRRFIPIRPDSQGHAMSTIEQFREETQGLAGARLPRVDAHPDARGRTDLGRPRSSLKNDEPAPVGSSACATRAGSPRTGRPNCAVAPRRRTGGGADNEMRRWLPPAADQPRHLDARAGAAGVWQRRAEARAAPMARGEHGARASPSPTRLRPGQPEDQRARGGNDCRTAALDLLRQQHPTECTRWCAPARSSPSTPASACSCWI
ncbi:hypothetical protein SSTU70S_00695 [Stutzerimonas stutzeri]